MCRSYRDISTSGLGCHIAISDCPSSSKLLFEISVADLSGSQSKINKFDAFLSKRLGYLPPSPKRNTCVEVEVQYEGYYLL